ncbi:hypothetical protein Pmani_018871 [Petrolisthes manimaculis]|uniref:Mon2/Sec7/BIG1-like HUS domain-containing protein n=1 Tax=Petrolisthes manimaculis TaxID=1843537 RepID=A0AAE1PJC4_9EUCA|nr:hypothetical protein Pmani_018871 [Petrolisthes manimaculis]
MPIVKVLRTVMTSEFVSVHRRTLLLLVRTCYNICLTSRSKANQNDTKNALMHIICIIFTRMECLAANTNNTTFPAPTPLGYTANIPTPIHHSPQTQQYPHHNNIYIPQTQSSSTTKTDPYVFSLCLTIVALLISSFKVHLKPQIEVFFQYILLHYLEAKSSSPQYKIWVLEALTLISQKPQTVVGLYVNYDCDWKARNLFQSLVNNLNTVA